MKIISSTSAGAICSIKVCEINKEDARTMLSTNTKNRKISRSNVDLLRRSMDDGKWMFNGDSIVFDNEGFLKSGQHRLTAFVESQLDKLTFVIVNLFSGEDVLLTLNRGQPLKTGQYLQIKGFKNANRVSANCKTCINLLKRGQKTISHALAQKVADYEIEQFAVQHPEYSEQSFLGQNGFRLKSPILGTIMYAIEKNCLIRDKLIDIVRKAGEGDSPKNSCMFHLLRISNICSRTMGFMTQEAMVGKTMRIITRFVFDRKEAFDNIYEMGADEFDRRLSMYSGE